MNRSFSATGLDCAPQQQDLVFKWEAAMLDINNDVDADEQSSRRWLANPKRTCPHALPSRQRRLYLLCRVIDRFVTDERLVCRITDVAVLHGLRPARRRLFEFNSIFSLQHDELLLWRGRFRRQQPPRLDAPVCHRFRTVRLADYRLNRRCRRSGRRLAPHRTRPTWHRWPLCIHSLSGKLFWMHQLIDTTRPLTFITRLCTSSGRLFFYMCIHFPFLMGSSWLFFPLLSCLLSSVWPLLQGGH